MLNRKSSEPRLCCARKVWLRRISVMTFVLAAAAALNVVRGVWVRAGETNEVASLINGTCSKLAGYQGAEDIVIDADRRVAYAVGGDRRSFRSGGPGRASIWAIPLDGDDNGPRVDISPSTPGTFRSFGADLHIDGDGTRRLFVASRPDDVHSVEVFKLNTEGRFEHERTLSAPLLRNPNEVKALGPDSALVTLDKEARAGSLLEVLEGATERLTGKVLLLAPGSASIVADRLNTANGIALAPDGLTAYVAELVGRSLVVFDRDPVTNALKRRSKILVDVSPDNLSVMPDGRVLVAGHPKLLTLALGYQNSEDKLSPSKVVVFDPATGTVRTVFASDGREIAASSVAVMDPKSKQVLIGSAFGPHVLRCQLKDL